MVGDSPFWPAQLDQCRIDAPEPSTVVDFYCAAIGYEAIDLAADATLLQGHGRRLVIGKGAAHGRPYHAYRLQTPRQLADVRAFVQAQGVNPMSNPSPLFEDDAIAVADPDGWVSVFGLGRRDLPSLKAANNRPPMSLPGRLQHIVVATDNLDGLIAFYENTLGFSPSDYVLKDVNDRASRHVAFWRSDEERHSFAAFGASASRHDHHAYETTGRVENRAGGDHLGNL